jgi:hypothetical protein
MLIDSSSLFSRTILANLRDPEILVRSPTIRNGTSGLRINGPCNRANPFRIGTAASTNDVDPPGAGEFAERPSSVCCVSGEPTKSVGHTCIGVAAYKVWAHFRQFLNVRAHLLHAHRAVKADAERREMLY